MSTAPSRAQAAAAPPAAASLPAPAATGRAASSALFFVSSLAAVCLGVLLALPLAVTHAVPANSLPPLAVWRAGFSLLAWVDALSRALTPPNLLLFRETMGYVHTSELYAAAELRLADTIFDGGVPLRDEGVPLSTLARTVAPGCAEPGADGADAPTGCVAVELRVERLLNALAALGIFAPAKGKSRAWVNTPTSDFLREAHP